MTLSSRSEVLAMNTTSVVAEALALADQLDAVPDTGADPDLIVEAAASLRLLCCLLGSVESVSAFLHSA